MYHACLIGGALSTLLETYRTQAEFLVVYLEEAHAKGEFGMGSKMSRNSRHTSIHDRINAAKDLVALDKAYHGCLSEDVSDTSRVRVVVDTMDNSFTSRFDAFPDRVFIIHDDKVAFVGSDIMDQMEHPEQLMTDEVREWLKERM
ncbi:thyroxine 5-deiodinase-like [Strongylocentrotus purpuratus]|uniref:Iodothyronine deiodinase n=1 Tax=Strongylocentrotus purpuratus TaxID=7668 RepID=A0A7M7PDJ7_STRPU|nr:thyroxine 5-deiodinase-like [Strongylocentrotus purpuratus]